jgi:hypothetical protein
VAQEGHSLFPGWRLHHAHACYLEIWEEMLHVFAIFSVFPESQVSIERMAKLINTSELDPLPGALFIVMESIPFCSAMASLLVELRSCGLISREKRQRPQVSMSILKTRFSRCAQIIAAGHSAGVLTSALATLCTPLPRLAGVISPRQRWFGQARNLQILFQYQCWFRENPPTLLNVL